MASANETPKLYELELGEFTVTIRGLTPLLVNKILDKDLDAMEGKQMGERSKGKAPREPEVEARGHLHIMEDGAHGFPAIGIKKAMVRAAKSTDMAMTDANNALQVIGDAEGLLAIRSDEPIMRRDFIKLQGRTGSLAYRPMFKEWEIDVFIRYNRRFVTAEQIINLLALAGFSPGIGAWRPECSGTFGTFEVKR